MYAEIELRALSEIFGNKGIEVVSKVADNSSKEEFLEHFNSFEYDAFWIMWHGEYNHYNAHNSFLNLGNNIFINLEELLARNYKSSERRLLIMDLCDATTSHMNNPVSIGLGTSLTHSSQSLIGYNWPVEPSQSFIIGMLLAGNLAEGQTYEDAHYNTIQVFHNGKHEVKARLEQIVRDGEVFERLERINFDFTNFYYWGSLNYVQ